jgi:hypothetical protein
MFDEERVLLAAATYYGDRVFDSTKLMLKY